MPERGLKPATAQAVSQRGVIRPGTGQNRLEASQGKCNRYRYLVFFAGLFILFPLFFDLAIPAPTHIEREKRQDRNCRPEQGRRSENRNPGSPDTLAAPELELGIRECLTCRVGER